MRRSRRALIEAGLATSRRVAGAAVAVLLLAATGAGAQSPAASYPNQGVRIVVPFGAGSITDTLARLVADHLGKAWGQNVVVENRPGLPGTTAVAKSAPDGYTLMVTSSGHVIARAVNNNVSFDPVADFAGITKVAAVPLVMIVPPDQPTKTLQDFIALARAKPGVLNYSSSGVTSASFLSAEVMRQEARIEMVHVPFKGVPEALTAVLRGDVEMNFCPVPDTAEMVAVGKVRALGINSPKRATQLPDVPAISEVLPGYNYESWFGLMAPAATPRAIIDKINADVSAYLKQPDTVARLEKLGSVPAPDTPAEFDALIKSDAERYTRVLAAAGIQAK